MKSVTHPKKFWFMLILAICLVAAAAWAKCKECEEVAKDQIPEQYLEPTLKVHPAGFAIWDIEEAVTALKKGGSDYLWVDTRPESFLKIGTIKSAAHLVCDCKGVQIPEEQYGPALTKERLMKAIGKAAASSGPVTVIFFCQGPRCHRSYNAALRAVNDFGLDSGRVIWFRAGYPNLEKHILENPKLKRRINRYLQGDVLNS